MNDSHSHEDIGAPHEPPSILAFNLHRRPGPLHPACPGPGRARHRSLRVRLAVRRGRNVASRRDDQGAAGGDGDRDHRSVRAAAGRRAIEARARSAGHPGDGRDLPRELRFPGAGRLRAGLRAGAPYRSWATEHVYVVDDSEKRISLQHILIMTIVGEDGEEMGPFVTKHWRQDWVYENPAVHTYRGFGTWARATRDEAERDGRWSQTVWQVDDSPRYAAWGEWRHTPERSWWTSEETWRPLPRREFSVRDDYDALVGTNTHVVLPTGWVHEQHNVKAVLGGSGEIEARLAREIGIVRYERLRNFETAPGNSYHENTAAFWGEVQAYWRQAMDSAERIRLKPEVDGQKLFQPLFERAAAIDDGEAFTREENQAFVVETIDAFRAAPEETGSTEY